MKIHIEQATPDKASHIASLIMEAMNTECCQNFAGPRHTLADFHQLMERLVKMEDRTKNGTRQVPTLEYTNIRNVYCVISVCALDNIVVNIRNSCRQHISTVDTSIAQQLTRQLPTLTGRQILFLLD